MKAWRAECCTQQPLRGQRSWGSGRGGLPDPTSQFLARAVCGSSRRSPSDELPCVAALCGACPEGLASLPPSSSSPLRTSSRCLDAELCLCWATALAAGERTCFPSACHLKAGFPGPVGRPGAHAGSHGQSCLSWEGRARVRAAAAGPEVAGHGGAPQLSVA